MNTTNQNNLRKVFLLLSSCFLLFFVFSVEAVAASFDCAKSLTAVEQAICSDANLSYLDEELNKIYKSVHTGQPDVAISQKKWLLHSRNRCGSTVCLDSAYKKRISELREMVTCSVGEGDVLGAWLRDKNGFFEEMLLSIDNGNKVFTSWLHHKPEMIGSWRIENCILKISGGENLNFDFKLKGIKKERLYLYDDETNGLAVYKKLKNTNN